MSIVANLKVNRIGGNYNEWWNMWFNAIIHVESYQLVIKLNYINKYKLIFKGYCMAVVSSCFDVLNSVFITNAILLILLFFFLNNKNSKLKSSPHDPSRLGYTRITMIKTTKFNKVI